MTSKIIEQKHCYVKIDEKSNTEIDNSNQIKPGFSYRQIQYSEQLFKKQHGTQLFSDQKFKQLGQEGAAGQIKFLKKRLSNLYGLQNFRVPFFNEKSKPSKSQYLNPNVPNCIKQLAHYPISHYKTFFLTQDFNKHGKYVLTLSINGKYEIVTVDDRIPINQKTLEPLWGLSYNNPWQLILIKAWAKVNGGYKNLFKSRPYEFVEAFSNSTWKYYNITQDSDVFLKYYAQKDRYKQGIFIIKTKNNEKVYNTGLLPNAAAYKILYIDQETIGQNKYNYTICLRATHESSWNGRIWTYDRNSIKYFEKIKHVVTDYNLHTDFYVTLDEFVGLFSSCYVNSARKQKYITGYQQFEISPNTSKAQFFEFQINDGFFDFSFKNDKKNLVDVKSQVGMHSTIYIEGQEQKGKAFRKMNIVLVKKNKKTQQTHQADGYPILSYKSFIFEAHQGYNKGEGHFVNLPAGHYYLRFKSQKSENPGLYSINWSSHQQIKIRLVELNNQQRHNLLHDAIVSISKQHKFHPYHISISQKTDLVSFSNSFIDIGYGFLAIKTKKFNTRQIIIQVDPQKLKQQGYKLKSKHKNQLKKFSIIVKKGDYESVIFKVDKHFKGVPVWPLQSIKIFVKQENKGTSKIVPQSTSIIPGQ